MEICLIRPSRCLDKEDIIINNSPALGLAFLAGALKQAGHTITVIDAIGESPMQLSPIGDIPLNITANLPLDRLYINGLTASEIAARIPTSVDIIGISAMFSNNWLFDRYLIDFIGEKFPNALMIAGGENITAMPALAIEQTRHLDICILGEGEETIVDLVNAVEKKEDPNVISGIACRDPETGKALFMPRRVRVKNIDEIPMPAWEYFPVENYLKYEIKWGVLKQNTMPLLATRGCPYSCTFCSSPLMWGTRYYMRDPGHIIQEMEYLMTTYGITNFDFFDLTAILKKTWIMEFTNEIIKRKLNITWELPVGTRSEVIDAEVAHNLYESGCRQVTYAPESGSISMLKLIKKKVKIPNMLQSIQAANREKLYTNINMIKGLPGETHADIWQTIWFLIQCSRMGGMDIRQSTFQPYPGSALFDQLVKDGKIDLSNDDFFLEMVFVTSNGTTKSYNDNVKAGWYNFYDLLSSAAFYGGSYFFHPSRFFRSIRNILTGEYEIRLERKLLEYFKQKKQNLKFGLGQIEGKG